MNWKILKSTIVILTGLVTVITISNGTDIIVEATGVFPTVEEQVKHGFSIRWMTSLALFYGLIYLVAGRYVVATLSPGKPILHGNGVRRSWNGTWDAGAIAT